MVFCMVDSLHFVYQLIRNHAFLTRHRRVLAQVDSEGVVNSFVSSLSHFFAEGFAHALRWLAIYPIDLDREDLLDAHEPLSEIQRPRHLQLLLVPRDQIQG